MDRPHIKQGVSDRFIGCCVAFLLALLLVGGCLPEPIVPIPDPINVNPVVPVPASGFKVLIVEETSRRDKLLPDQVDIFVSSELRRSLSAMKVELRIWDQMIDAENESDAAWRAMLAQPRASLPWIVISGKSGYSGPLPATVADTIKLIEKHR